VVGIVRCLDQSDASRANSDAFWANCDSSHGRKMIGIDRRKRELVQNNINGIGNLRSADLEIDILTGKLRRYIINELERHLNASFIFIAEILAV